MHVLVTGANGFVGQVLCRRLAADGHQLTAVVRDTAEGVAAIARVARVARLPAGTRESWLAQTAAGVDAVVHLAGHAHRGEALTESSRQAFRATNVDFTREVHAAGVAAGVAHFVFMSSCKVYGERSPAGADGAPRPFDPESPAHPEGPYGESKLAAELCLRDGCRRAGMALTILRPPLVYGPGVGGNLRSLLGALARGVPLPFGAIRNRRSLVHVESLAAIVVRCLGEPGRASGVFTPADITLSTPDLVRCMAGGLGRRARLWWVPPAMLRLAGRLTGHTAAMSRLTDSFVLDAGTLATTLDWRPDLDVEAAWREIGTAYWRASGRA
ncbi:MAG: NAD-dependent epimerase/dehydratase family protein [Gammaproteobacteria bacterium]